MPARSLARLALPLLAASSLGAQRFSNAALDRESCPYPHASVLPASGPVRDRMAVRAALEHTRASRDHVVQRAFVKASNPDQNDWFGLSIAVDGDLAVVGAPHENSAARGVDGDQDDESAPFAGAAYVFVRDGATWRQDAYLKASNSDFYDHFGWSVAVSGETIVVGAHFEDSAARGVDGDQSDRSASGAGAAYVFARDSTGAWQQEAYLKASNTDAQDSFGESVAISGDRIAVGASYEDSNSSGVNGTQGNRNADTGAVYLFTRSGRTWSSGAYLKASNTGRRDRFGAQLALDGDTLVVAAPFEDSGAVGVDGDQADNSERDSGAAYVFVRRADSWEQQAYLKASNTSGSPAGFTSSDGFGWGLDLSGDTLVVGAPFEASDATGIDGDQENDDSPQAGAAYVFARDGASWSQEAYVKPSNTGIGFLFASSVALDGDTLAIGALGDQSASVGVNGDQGDRGAGGSGAVYLYRRDAGTWSQTAYVKASNPGIGDALNIVALDGDTLWVGSVGEDSDTTGVNPPWNDVALQFDAGATYLFDLAAACGASRYGGYSEANTADLHSLSRPEPGELFRLDLTGFGRSGTAIVLLSTAPADAALFGGTLFVDPGQALPAPVRVRLQHGSGQVEAPLPLAAAGLTFYAQAALFGSSPSELVLTNGLRVEVCP